MCITCDPVSEDQSVPTAGKYFKEGLQDICLTLAGNPLKYRRIAMTPLKAADAIQEGQWRYDHELMKVGE